MKKMSKNGRRGINGKSNKRGKGSKSGLIRESLLGWNGLQRGDLVDVVAPASQGPLEELEAGIKVIESWGLRVRVSPHLYSPTLLHSNTDQERWNQLKTAILNKESAAIWCVRGGYGSMKLLPQLLKLKKPKHTKIFLGLSDITSLNVFFNQKWKWPVLHAPVLTRIGRGDLPKTSIDELKQVLFGNVSELQYPLTPLNAAAEKCKRLSGNLVGGNWTTLMAGIATSGQLRPAQSILFLEDIGERGYRLDRYWEQLLQMGFLDQLNGIVLGDFTLGDEPDGKNYIWDVLRERASVYKKPIFYGMPSGHGMIQRVLPLGVSIQIKMRDHQFNAEVPTGVAQR
jgi:muramoyltetrapeptide carboxypeptidase